MKILITADWHIKGERPIFRLDENWIESQRETIAAICSEGGEVMLYRLKFYDDFYKAPRGRCRKKNCEE